MLSEISELILFDLRLGMQTRGKRDVAKIVKKKKGIQKKGYTIVNKSLETVILVLDNIRLYYNIIHKCIIEFFLQK